MSDVVYEGYLEKRSQASGIGKGWNRRYFVLKRSGALGSARLEYYPDMNKAARQQKRSIIPLREVTAVHQTPHKARQFVFDITTPILHYQLAAASQKEVDAWVDSISDVAFGSHGSQSAMHQQMVPQPQPQPQYQPQYQPQMGLLVDPAPPPYMRNHPQDYRFSSPGAPPVNMPVVHAQNPNLVPQRPTPGVPMHGRLDSSSGIQTSEEAMRMTSNDNPFLPSEQEQGIQENTLYSGLTEEKRYRVVVIPTEASEGLRLAGEYHLIVSATSLALESIKTGQRLLAWPLKYLRRYGRDFTKFTFESGRKCESGAGVFFLSTNLGNEIFHLVHDNVKAIGSQQHSSLKQEDIVRVSKSRAQVAVPEVRRNTMPSVPNYPAAPKPQVRPAVPPMQKPLSRTQSDLNPLIMQQVVQEISTASPLFIQEVSTEECDEEPEHFYEEGEDSSTLGKAISAARAASYDVMQIANGTPVPHSATTSATFTSQQNQTRHSGYDRLVIGSNANPDPVYDEAELDSLMATIAQHVEDSSSYNTIVRDSSTARPAGKSPTIDDNEVTQLENLLENLSQEEEAADVRPSMERKDRYDFLPPPRQAVGPTSDVQILSNTADANTIGVRYQNVSTGQEVKAPYYTNVATDNANDEFECSESEELNLDDYTPLEEKERKPAKPPRTTVPFFPDTELDDPEYGVPKITHN
jgi:hypothetical protein